MRGWRGAHSELRDLLAGGADPDYRRNFDGEEEAPPAWFAAARGSIFAAHQPPREDPQMLGPLRLMLAAGASLQLGSQSHNGQGKYGMSGIVASRANGRRAYVQLLRDHGCPDYTDTAGQGGEPDWSPALAAAEGCGTQEELMDHMSQFYRKKRAACKARVSSPEAVAGELDLCAHAAAHPGEGYEGFTGSYRASWR